MAKVMLLTDTFHMKHDAPLCVDEFVVTDAELHCPSTCGTLARQSNALLAAPNDIGGFT